DAVPGVVVLVHAVEVVLADPGQPLVDVVVVDVALAAQALVGAEHVLGDEQRRNAGGGHRGGRLAAAAGPLAVAVVIPAAVGKLVGLPCLVDGLPHLGVDLVAALAAGPQAQHTVLRATVVDAAALAGGVVEVPAPLADPALV